MSTDLEGGLARSPGTVRAVSTVPMDLVGRIRVPRAAAVVAALLRIGLGLAYLWAFITQELGVVYSNSAGSKASPSYGWHLSYAADQGWISSAFTHSPTATYVASLHGPLAFIPKNLPTGLDDFGWMLATGGLGIALTFGIFMGIAGWGGFVLNMLLWFSTFPPQGNPMVDGEHMAYGFGILLLMFLQAGNHIGFGRWWRHHTPPILHYARSRATPPVTTSCVKRSARRRRHPC